MKELFNDILKMDGIKGVLLISFSGEIIFRELKMKMKEEPTENDWKLFIESINGIRETDLIFKGGRIYLRKSELGYLIILMDFYASAAMIRLNSDIILPSLKPAKAAKGLSGFFKKKK